MKLVTISKLKNFALNDVNNFNKDLTVNVQDVMDKYTNLLVEYIQFILGNIKIQKREYADFIINRGLDMITNVFTNILYCTKNLELAFFHTQKSFYFYVEFICQISEAEKLFLQLSSRDAMIYVYKKTMFDLNHNFVKNIEECSQTSKDKFDEIIKRIAIARKMMYFIVTTTDAREPYIKKFAVTTSKFNSISLSKSTIDMVETTIDILYTKTECISMFYSTMDLLVKKLFICNPDVCLHVNKIYDIDDESPSEIVCLLF